MTAGGGSRPVPGGFARSAGGAMARGVVLVAVAVALGVVLLRSADEGFDGAVGTAGPGTTPPAGITTTTAAPTTTTTTAPLRPVAQVKVLAANGTGVRGLAGRYRDQLKALGYNALAPTDTQRKPVATSAVYFAAGFEGEARRLAGQLGIATVAPMPQPPPVANLLGANLLVVVGQDKAATATTTTVRRATTTTARPRATTTTSRP